MNLKKCATAGTSPRRNEPENLLLSEINTPMKILYVNPRGLTPFASAILLGAFLAIGTIARGEVFKDGETVCFLGDSITAGGRTQTIIADYYLTRFPERTIHFLNAGRSGDSAGGALGRLKEDVIDKKPTSVSIMLGMNDVGRGYYVESPTELQLKSQKKALEDYQANMENVVARVRADAGEPKLLFITPSPFDQTVVLEKSNN